MTLPCGKRWMAASVGCTMPCQILEAASVACNFSQPPKDGPPLIWKERRPKRTSCCCTPRRGEGPGPDLRRAREYSNPLHRNGPAKRFRMMDSRTPRYSRLLLSDGFLAAPTPIAQCGSAQWMAGTLGGHRLYRSGSPESPSPSREPSLRFLLPHQRDGCLWEVANMP